MAAAQRNLLPATRSPKRKLDDEEILDVLPAKQGWKSKDRDDDEFDNTGDAGRHPCTLIPYRNPMALADLLRRLCILDPAGWAIDCPFCRGERHPGNPNRTHRAGKPRGLVHACIGILFGMTSLLCHPLCLLIYYYTFNQKLVSG